MVDGGRHFEARGGDCVGGPVAGGIGWSIFSFELLGSLSCNLAHSLFDSRPLSKFYYIPFEIIFT